MDEMYNKGEMEAACDAFTDLAREKPGDKQTQTYRTLSCTQVKAAQKMEENLFNEGVKFYEQGQYDDARQRFQQSGKIQGLKNFHYKDKAVQYLRMIESRQKEEAAFQEAVKLYNERQYSQAQSLFNQLALGGGAKARDAGDYLAKIKAELSKPPAPKIEQPQPKEVVKKEPSKPPVKKEIANVVSPPPPRPEPLPPPKPTPSDETLRAGLRAYYAGDLEEAERDLSEYLTHNGQKQGLAYFFRGAAHSTRYFLNGEKDSSEKEQAVKDFQSAKSQGQGFQPPVQKYISPKILALYSQAATP
jgi:TolA-binding protein